MSTADLVFRGRRLSRDRTLVLAEVAELPEPQAQEAVRRASADGADAVTVTGSAETVSSLVKWLREEFPDVVAAVAATDPETARAACAAGAELIVGPGALAAVAAEYAAGFVTSVPAEAAGVPAAGLVRDGGLLGTSSKMPSDDPVALRVDGDGTPAGLALASLAASAGVALLRTADVRRVRHVVDMAASIAGTRPPAKAVRWE